MIVIGASRALTSAALPTSVDGPRWSRASIALDARGRRLLARAQFVGGGLAWACHCSSRAAASLRLAALGAQAAKITDGEMRSSRAMRAAAFAWSHLSSSWMPPRGGDRPGARGMGTRISCARSTIACGGDGNRLPYYLHYSFGHSVVARPCSGAGGGVSRRPRVAATVPRFRGGRYIDCRRTSQVRCWLRPAPHQSHGAR